MMLAKEKLVCGVELIRKFLKFLLQQAPLKQLLPEPDGHRKLERPKPARR